MVDLLPCWSGIQGNCQIAAVWKMLPLCLCSGAFGMRGMDVVLYIENDHWWGLENYSFILCYFALRLLYWRWLTLLIYMLLFIARKL